MSTKHARSPHHHWLLTPDLSLQLRGEQTVFEGVSIGRPPCRPPRRELSRSRHPSLCRLRNGHFSAHKLTFLSLNLTSLSLQPVHWCTPVRYAVYPWIATATQGQTASIEDGTLTWLQAVFPEEILLQRPVHLLLRLAPHHRTTPLSNTPLGPWIPTAVQGCDTLIQTTRAGLADAACAFLAGRCMTCPPCCELRNVSLKLRNVRLKLRNVSLTLRNVS